MKVFQNDFKLILISINPNYYWKVFINEEAKVEFTKFTGQSTIALKLKIFVRS